MAIEYPNFDDPEYIPPDEMAEAYRAVQSARLEYIDKAQVAMLELMTKLFQAVGLQASPETDCKAVFEGFTEDGTYEQILLWMSYLDEDIALRTISNQQVTPLTILTEDVSVFDGIASRHMSGMRFDASDKEIFDTTASLFAVNNGKFSLGRVAEQGTPLVGLQAVDSDMSGTPVMPLIYPMGKPGRAEDDITALDSLRELLARTAGYNPIYTEITRFE